MSDGTRIFVLVQLDRHTDPIIRLRTNRAQCIDEAKKLAQEHCRDPEDFVENNPNEKVFLYHAIYSCEGDSVYVIEKVVGE